MKYFHSILRCNSRSHSRSLTGITTSHSRSGKLGMEFVIPIPVPKNSVWNLSFPFPFPKVGNAIFHSRSRSQNLGMQFSIPVPVTGIGLSRREQNGNGDQKLGFRGLLTDLESKSTSGLVVPQTPRYHLRMLLNAKMLLYIRA